MPLADLVERLQLADINWALSHDSPYLFEAVFEDKLVRLRLNDFPDEALCTVIVDGKEVDLGDMTNFPSGWMLPLPDKRRAWRELLLSWGIDCSNADQAYDDMCASYAGSGRFYHTLNHAFYVVQKVTALGWHAKHVGAVKLSAWLHDVIYDSRASDNEERSAKYATMLCQRFSIPNSAHVAWLIMQTKTHDFRVSENEKRSREVARKLCKDLGYAENSPTGALLFMGRYFPDEDTDAQVLIDSDLAILGETDDVYRTYAEQIRQEYAWVPEPEFREGRRGVLQQFLARPRIYHMLTEREEPARRNMAAEIARLQADGGSG